MRLIWFLSDKMKALQKLNYCFVSRGLLGGDGKKSFQIGTDPRNRLPTGQQSFLFLSTRPANPAGNWLRSSHFEKISSQALPVRACWPHTPFADALLFAPPGRQQLEAEPADGNPLRGLRCLLEPCWPAARAAQGSCLPALARQREDLSSFVAAIESWEEIRGSGGYPAGLDSTSATLQYY